MPHMPVLDLMHKPPVSYTIPLPTQAIVRLASGFKLDKTTSFGECFAALPTLYIPPNPWAFKSSPSITLASRFNALATILISFFHKP